MPAMHAYMDEYRKITILIHRNFYQGRSEYFYLTSPQGHYVDLKVVSVDDSTTTSVYCLTIEENLPFGLEYTVHESHGLCVPLEMRLICQTERFSREFYVDDVTFGAQYSKENTKFALWAPTATGVSVKVMDHGETHIYPMQRQKKGVYTASVKGNLSHAVYAYLVARNGQIIETVDPYGESSNANSRYSAVIDEKVLETIPEESLRTHIEQPVESVIYECSVRDMTSFEQCGSLTHGTFEALAQEQTSYKGFWTGMSYLANLGVTHVQLQPVMDFATVDELHPKRNYNWGYDPAQYLTLEGSYSSNPQDPYARMKEFKKLVSVFHKNDMRVTLDVVFNHVYDSERNPFHNTVPYYWFRYNERAGLSNGTYCGNDFSSAQPMVRKYIVDVCKKLVRLYDIDGFRFDLMGILDVETINQVKEEVRKIKKDAIFYGEGWDMPTLLDPKKKACIVNQNLMEDVGHFNDYFRDIVKGRTSDDARYEKGYITGALDKAFAMCSAVTGNVLGDPYFFRFSDANKTINSVETHDNGTAWDKMRSCCHEEPRDIRLRRMKMLNATVLFSIGVPFLHAGQEFCGTKNDNCNSYNAGDDINQMNWERAIMNRGVVEYTRKAISIRKLLKGFHVHTQQDIQQCVHVSIVDNSVVVMDIDHEDKTTNLSHIRVIFNPTYDYRTYYYNEEWMTIFDENGNTSNEPRHEVYVPGLSVIVAVR